MGNRPRASNKSSSESQPGFGSGVRTFMVKFYPITVPRAWSHSPGGRCRRNPEGRVGGHTVGIRVGHMQGGDGGFLNDRGLVPRLAETLPQGVKVSGVFKAQTGTPGP